MRSRLRAVTTSAQQGANRLSFCCPHRCPNGPPHYLNALEGGSHRVRIQLCLLLQCFFRCLQQAGYGASTLEVLSVDRVLQTGLFGFWLSALLSGRDNFSRSGFPLPLDWISAGLEHCYCGLSLSQDSLIYITNNLSGHVGELLRRFLYIRLLFFCH